jgi:hypothetical protein
MGYSHQNSRGVTYYLHARQTPKGAKLMFFSKDPADSIDLPDNMEVFENERTGLPMVRKKA